MSTHEIFGDDITGTGADTGDGSLFASTMGFVAMTTAFFALGAYLGRDMTPGWGLVFFALAFAILIGMRFTVRSGGSSSLGLLMAFGLFMGLATGPTVAYYAGTDPATIWKAAGATTLFMGGLGVAGYATRQDLSNLGRMALWALVGLIGFGVVSIFLQIPGSSLTYSVLGLVVFAALVLVDFQRLRISDSSDSPSFLAESIFLDALNVFLFFLNIFDRRSS